MGYQKRDLRTVFRTCKQRARINQVRHFTSSRAIPAWFLGSCYSPDHSLKQFLITQVTWMLSRVCHTYITLKRTCRPGNCSVCPTALRNQKGWAMHVVWCEYFQLLNSMTSVCLLPLYVYKQWDILIVCLKQSFNLVENNIESVCCQFSLHLPILNLNVTTFSCISVSLCTFIIWHCCSFRRLLVLLRWKMSSRNYCRRKYWMRKICTQCITKCRWHSPGPTGLLPGMELRSV